MNDSKKYRVGQKIRISGFFKEWIGKTGHIIGFEGTYVLANVPGTAKDFIILLPDEFQVLDEQLMLFEL